MVGALILFIYQYQQRITHQEKELKKFLKSEELKSAYALLEGQDKERNRIAHDLHDRMGGQLSSVKIYLDLLNNTSLSPEQEQLLSKLHQATEYSIEEVRAIAHNLSHSSLTMYGLPKAVDYLCKAINDSKQINASVFTSINREIPKSIAKELYHIIQELITNTLRHAEATKVRIDLTSLEEEVNLIYHDDGKGFKEMTHQEGIGLNGIRLRVEKHNGIFTIESGTGIGSTFIIEIPLHHGK